MPSSLAALLGRAARRLPGRRPWRLAALWLKGLRILLVDLAGIAGALILILFVWREATREVVQIDPISVPPSLADDGYSGEVLAHRLMDHIIAIQVGAKTTMPTRVVDVAGRQADFVVPGIGFSVGTAATFVGELLGTQRTRVRGEITRQGDLYSFYLRVDGRGTVVGPVARQDLDTVLKSGAEWVVRTAEPYVLASYHYDIDKELALSEADAIIATATAGRESRVRAYNLRGLILADRKQYEDAIENYQAAIEIDPGFAMSYSNLGTALLDTGKFDEGLSMHRKAVALERTPATYNDLANFLLDRGRVDEAIEYYRRAVALDGAIAVLHSNLGEALRRQGRTDEALQSLRAAIVRDRNNAFAYFNLALVYRDKGSAGEAIANLRKAIALQPVLAPAHQELGLMLKRLALNHELAGEFGAAESTAREACEAIRQSVRLEPGNAEYRAELEKLNDGAPEAKRCAAP